MPSSIRCWDSNPQPLEHGSPTITTRPGLPPMSFYSFCGMHCAFSMYRMLLKIGQRRLPSASNFCFQSSKIAWNRGELNFLFKEFICFFFYFFFGWKLTGAGETIAFVARVTGTGETAQSVGTLGENVTRSIFALVFVYRITKILSDIVLSFCVG